MQKEKKENQDCKSIDKNKESQVPKDVTDQKDNPNKPNKDTIESKEKKDGETLQSIDKLKEQSLINRSKYKAYMIIAVIVLITLNVAGGVLGFLYMENRY